MDSHRVIAEFCTRLPLRPDAEHVRSRLAAAFVEHRDQLWPQGDPAATPDWINGNVDEVLATLERLFAFWIDNDDEARAIEFLYRRSWLPPLLADIDRKHLDG